MARLDRRTARKASLIGGVVMLLGTVLIVRDQMRVALDLDFDPSDSAYWNEGLGSVTTRLP